MSPLSENPGMRLNSLPPKSSHSYQLLPALPFQSLILFPFSSFPTAAALMFYILCILNFCQKKPNKHSCLCPFPHTAINTPPPESPPLRSRHSSCLTFQVLDPIFPIFSPLSHTPPFLPFAAPKPEHSLFALPPSRVCPGPSMYLAILSLHICLLRYKLLSNIQHRRHCFHKACLPLLPLSYVYAFFMRSYLFSKATGHNPPCTAII